MKIITNFQKNASFIYNKKNLGFLIIFMGVFFFQCLKTPALCSFALTCIVFGVSATNNINLGTK